jgi:hypothetical protein
MIAAHEGRADLFEACPHLVGCSAKPAAGVAGRIGAEAEYPATC